MTGTSYAQDPRSIPTDSARALVKSGVSIAETARRLGVTREALSKKLAAPGARGARPVPLDVPEILRLAKLGYSASEIAQKVGRNVRAIRRAIARERTPA